MSGSGSCLGKGILAQYLKIRIGQIPGIIVRSRKDACLGVCKNLLVPGPAFQPHVGNASGRAVDDLRGNSGLLQNHVRDFYIMPAYAFAGIQGFFYGQAGGSLVIPDGVPDLAADLIYGLPGVRIFRKGKAFQNGQPDSLPVIFPFFGNGKGLSFQNIAAF